MKKKLKKIILITTGLVTIPMISIISSCSTQKSPDIKPNPIPPIEPPKPTPTSPSITNVTYNTTNTGTTITFIGSNLPFQLSNWTIINKINSQDVTRSFEIMENSNLDSVIFKTDNISLMSLRFKINGTNIEKDVEINKNPDIQPEKFDDKHLFSLTKLQNSKNINEILTNTPLFQTSLKNLMHLLKNYHKDWDPNNPGIDFTNPMGQYIKLNTDFYKAIKDIGFYGDYKIDSNYDYIKYFPTKFIKEHVSIQKTLPPPSNEILSLPIEEISLPINKINELIKNNVFGFLPSNLSQFLYYLSLIDIASYFEINEEIKEVYSIFNDQSGEISLYFKINEQKVLKLVINKTTHNNLKSIVDYKQFIYDRSFIISTQLWHYAWINPQVRKGYEFKEINVQGSAWIIDRIRNPELEKQNKYEFLVGTNLHVLDFSKGFEKNGVLAINQLYDQNWNGGFISKEKNAAGSAWVYNDKKTKHISTNGVSYETLERTKKTTSSKLKKYNYENDISKIEETLARDDVVLKKHEINSQNINSKNYLDTVWYTPNFKSENVRARNTSNSDYFFGDNYDHSNNLGDVFNGGMDFAITKLVFSADEIKTLFPSLDKILNTEKEKDWYVGLGNNEKINPNNTVFVGGFPENDWKAVQSIGGVIETKQRLIDATERLYSATNASNETQTYWKRFNEQENNEMNKYNFKKDWYTTNPRNDLEHGMAIEQVLQNSTLKIKTKDDNYLLGGASGSMAIDSRFNLVGVLFSGIFETAEDTNVNAITNNIALFKHHSKLANWSGSVYEDVLSKIKKDGLYTIKMRPN